MFRRKGSAVWQGNLKGGKGTISSESGALRHVPYAFAFRFENEVGTNPEELVAAAHAACFSMAYASHLEGKGIVMPQIRTTATATIERQEAGWTVTRLHLDVDVKAPGADRSILQVAADTARATCPISRLLKANITMDARFES